MFSVRINVALEESLTGLISCTSHVVYNPKQAIITLLVRLDPVSIRALKLLIASFHNSIKE